MNSNRTSEILTAIRSQLDELEIVLTHAKSATDQMALPVFDPDIDAPPVTPLVDGSRIQQDWCGLLLWTGLMAINVRQGRAATPDESVAIAKNAGYRDGRGWNAWAPGAFQKDADGGRCITEPGMKHAAHYYETVGRRMPDDLFTATQAASQ